MNLYRVNTTAYGDDDFLLFTDLTDAQISEVISPVVERERKNIEHYDNKKLFESLKKAYPDSIIHYFNEVTTKYLSV